MMFDAKMKLGLDARPTKTGKRRFKEEHET
jgi:hypothetical protein